ncbi:hypothetical protein SUGI_0750850 [Cryptomeria japonica]|uniref:protein LURP-one-related 8 n=1 Tax=Cryptomeria japonica TaxID=3369 RepID=UPI002414AEF1|nr:protein LURP-one-related 8 [Cryptomeria japonica]GLJ37059.1 hypothetical protein SUGI_0750850 [Cryptomeria japonica]
MAKIHPRVPEITENQRAPEEGAQPVSLTVWNKSLLFNSKGFTVYDSNGNLVFRVDNYACNPTSEMILMDATGNDLLVLKRKRFSIRRQWQGFCENNRIFRMKKSTRRWWLSGKKKTLAKISLNSSKNPEFYVEGSFSKKSCAVYNSAGGVVAEVKRKQAATTSPSACNCMLQADVFSLVVHPGYDQKMVMGFVISLDSLSKKPTFLRRL